ncbi:hypothetical protein [Paenibacillus glucanolyticus]|uniref:hypothetical protein n=1 Tax=Paenibacillus glucanolyticus TaxID=59843 RepID=UPI00096F5889|nr:hypothetical protein [Paenibacillus glucanolyticus]OMF80177.1 hypothetical protein BK142_06795 [Paenibacillus glucanolyticus]
MSDKSWRIFIMVVALIILSGVLYSVLQSVTSFRELVPDRYSDTQKIRDISIEKFGDRWDDIQRVEIMDPDMIDRIMNNFSEVKLIRTENYTIGTYYYIRINYEHTLLTIMYTEPDNMRIDLNQGTQHKRYSWTYKIASPFDRSIIEDLFN